MFISLKCMPLQLPASQLCATVLSLHVVLWNLAAIHLLSACLFSSLSPSNLDPDWLPMGNNRWLTLTDTDHSYSLCDDIMNGGHQQPRSVTLGFCCGDHFLNLILLFSEFLEAIQETREMPEGTLLLCTIQVHLDFSRCVSRGSCYGVSVGHNLRHLFLEELSLVLIAKSL